MRIFNDKEVDELILLDIGATVENRKPDFTHIEDIVSESFMPLTYGGGIHNLKDAERLLRIGIEKISLNTAIVENPELVHEAANTFGNQSIVASIDVRKNLWGKFQVHTHRGKKNTKIDPVELARKMEDKGVGEILLTSISHEGSMKGYDLDLTSYVASAVSVPVIAHGGAGSLRDFNLAVKTAGASAVAAGSMFVFHGKLRGVLINYPSPASLKILFEDETYSRPL
jgi:cyclase